MRVVPILIQVVQDEWVAEVARSKNDIYFAEFRCSLARLPKANHASVLRSGKLREIRRRVAVHGAERLVEKLRA